MKYFVYSHPTPIVLSFDPCMYVDSQFYILVINLLLVLVSTYEQAHVIFV
jgi:hypothetical protein